MVMLHAICTLLYHFIIMLLEIATLIISLYSVTHFIFILPEQRTLLPYFIVILSKICT